MLFMVIEQFHDGKAAAVYERARTSGRQLPDGLTYVDSWVTGDFSRCFQIMECDDERLFEPWIAAWSDLVSFEIVPIMGSATAAAHFSSGN